MSHINRRRFCTIAAVTVSGGRLDLVGISRRLNTMTDVMPEVIEQKEGEQEEIRPFVAAVPNDELAELRRRIEATRWPTKELVGDRSQGVQLATLKALVRYWQTEYDWRKGEARL